MGCRLRVTMVEPSEPSEIIPIDDKDVILEERYPTNLSMKREARMEYEYFLWLRGKKLREIAANPLVGVSLQTVWSDLNEFRANLNETPRDMMQIRMETLLSLRLLHQDVLFLIKEARKVEKPNYSHISKLIAEAADIDKTILTRYTQPGSAQEVKAEVNDQLMAMVDYLTEKLGPESMDDFMFWWKGRMAVKSLVK